ncbi:MAG: hypothetical protein ACLSEH_12305 [Alistipes onderdonkii]|jgi:hypothetical protein
MKTYLATVCLTKTYTDKMCNQVLLQKEFPDEKAAHVWLNKALKRYNYVKGIKDLCYVSWFSLDDENGNQLLYFDYFSSDVPHEIQVRVTLTKKYPAQKQTIVLTHKCACYNHAILWIDWAYLKFESSENATFSSGEMIDAKTEIVIDK